MDSQEEIKKKEEEEFDKWKDMFETSEGGAQADDDMQESQGLLQEFIDHLRNSKIAALDEVTYMYGCIYTHEYMKAKGSCRSSLIT